MKRVFKKIKEKVQTLKKKITLRSKKSKIKKRKTEFMQETFPTETKVEETKYYTPPFMERYPKVEQLPASYGQDRLVLQTRDPWWVQLPISMYPPRVTRL
jgi:hypothetical protein